MLKPKWLRCRHKELPEKHLQGHPYKILAFQLQQLLCVALYRQLILVAQVPC